MQIFLVSGSDLATCRRLSEVLAGKNNVFHLGDCRSAPFLNSLAAALKSKIVGFARCAIDDIQTAQEVLFFKERFPISQHFHVEPAKLPPESLSMIALEFAMSSDYAVVT